MREMQSYPVVCRWAPRLSPVAVLVGLSLDNLATAMLVKLVSAAWTESTDQLLAAIVVLGALCSVFGGYAAGRVAGFRETLHGLIVGIGDIVIGVTAVIYFATPLPFWYTAVSILSIVPATTLGGYRAGCSREAAARE